MFLDIIHRPVFFFLNTTFQRLDSVPISSPEIGTSSVDWAQLSIHSPKCCVFKQK
jgi:hypothetical protein